MRRVPRKGGAAPGGGFSSAATYAPWAFLVVALYYSACTLPALGFDDGTRWKGSDALWSALFPVFWIGDPRSVPAAASNVALFTACGMGLGGRPRRAWQAALGGLGLGLGALGLLRLTGPVSFDEGGVSHGQFDALYPGAILWLLAFIAAAVGGLAAYRGSRSGRGPRILAAGTGAALAVATIVWKTQTAQGLALRVAAAIRADDAPALERAFRRGGSPDDLHLLAAVDDLARAHAARAAEVARARLCEPVLDRLAAESLFLDTRVLDDDGRRSGYGAATAAHTAWRRLGDERGRADGSPTPATSGGRPATRSRWHACLGSPARVRCVA